MTGVLSQFKSRKLPFMAGLIVAATLLTGGAGLATRGASAANCSNNDIMKCGFSTAGDFRDKASANNSGGHNDLQSIYAHQFMAGQSLQTSEYNNFASKAVSGTAYKDGRVVLDNGQVVANGAHSIGRIASQHGTNYQTYNVNGVNYYGNVTAKTFASNSLPVYVMFNAQGTMQFAVIKSCGNPVFGAVVQTGASCNALTATPVPDQLNTYSFSATANLTGNATLKSCTYTFGDGNAKNVAAVNNTCPGFQYAYSKASPDGGFTATVTEYASVPGNDNLELPVISMCTKQIVVVLPMFSCLSLNPVTIDKSKYSYRYVATANIAGGAVFTSTDYDFGDGQTQSVNTTDGKTTSVDHTFPDANSHNVSALLHFTVSGQPQTAGYKCTANEEASTCKPDIPVGDVRCNPCPTNPAVPATDTVNCVMPPPTLPNTGAGNTIAIFAAVIVGGFLVYRQLLFRKHKAAFAAAVSGTSPLPLGDPLNQEAPLAGTPLAAKRRSFRKRQF